ncbi:MAG: hypothetical protein ABII85_01485 [Bacillota bacterium]
MNNNIKLSTWIESFNEGNFELKDVQTQIKAGWYDWFCKDSSLGNKTKLMGNIIKQIKSGGKVELEKNYVWLKNNCPLGGPLYDDFRIADLDSGDTLYTTQIDCYRNEFRYVVYGKMNDFKDPLYQTNSSKELVKWFNEGWNE